MREPSGIWKESRIRVFISHASSVRSEVAEFAGVLDDFGFSTFVAHDDIEPSRDWSTVIEEALTTCDVLVAYLTREFHESNWTDQEVGWAMGRGALVVPLNVGLTPYGFIGRYQAAHASRGRGYGWETAETVTRAVAVAVFEGQRAMAERLTTSMTAVITRAFELTPSFDMGRFNFALVERVPAHLWSDELLHRLEEAARTNGQLRECSITDRGGLPGELDDLVTRVRAGRGTASVATGSGTPATHIATPPAVEFVDAPLLNWQSPAVGISADKRLTVDVWCSNEGPIGSLARIRYRAAYFHNVGTPPESGIPMEFDEFDVDTSVYSVHANLASRLLVKIRSDAVGVLQLGPLQFTWQVVYTDGRLRPYLTQASVTAMVPGSAAGRLELVDRPTLDNTDALTRHRRYLAVLTERPDSPVIVPST